MDEFYKMTKKFYEGENFHTQTKKNLDNDIVKSVSNSERGL